jgi:ferredoxin
MVTAGELKSVAFPECAKNCAANQVLGCGECESVCSFKFRLAPDKPFETEAIPQNELDCISNKEN